MAGYDSRTGRCSYPNNGRKLSEAEVLRRAQVDKKTIKRPYHTEARAAIRKFISWTSKKYEDHSSNKASDITEKNALRVAISEREDIAQRYGAIEYKLAETQNKLSDALERENRHLKRIRELEEQVASYIKALVSLDEKLIKFPRRT